MKHDQTLMSRHNVLVRLAVTTVYNILMTTIACMLPFFIDFVALVGAIGFTPLDFIVPVILYLKVKMCFRNLSCRNVSRQANSEAGTLSTDLFAMVYAI